MQQSTMAAVKCSVSAKTNDCPASGLRIAAASFNLSDFASISLIAVVWFGLAGLVNYRLGRYFNYVGIQRIGVARATPMIAVSPLFALILAVSFLGESVNLFIIAGTLLVVGGVSVLVSRE